MTIKIADILQSRIQDPLSLPPLQLVSDDFNYLMRRFNADTFRAQDGELGFILFDSKQEVGNGRALKGTTKFSVDQPCFLVSGSDAIQIYIRPDASPGGARQYLKAISDGPVPNSSIIIERKSDEVIVSTSLFNRDIQTRKYFKGDIDTSKLNYHPYPAVPRVFLHNDITGYVCFAFERVGCHPYVTKKGQPVTGIRCLYGDVTDWKEADVLKCTLGARGTGNLNFETTIGSFFIPGENSMGDCLYTPRGGSSTDCRVFELESLKDPQRESFDIQGYKALSSLGLPPVWPNPYFL